MESENNKGNCLYEQIPHDCSESPISKIPDEFLIRIFLLLPITDRIRIQRVCKHWQAVSLKSWSSCQTLTFQEKDWGYKHWFSKGIDMLIFEKVLKLCGLYITSVDFSKHDQDPDFSKFIKSFTANENFFVIIKNHCPNLTALDIRGLDATVEGIEYLGKNYLNFTEFAMDADEEKLERFDEPLSLLFRNNQNLRRVILDVPFRGHCLRYLNPTAIQEIFIKRGSGREKSVCKTLKKFKNLKSVSIRDDNFDRHENAGVYYINKMLKSIKKSQNLRELDISTMANSLIAIDSKNFRFFSNLQKLSLCGEELKFEFGVITNYCTKLTCVKLMNLPVTDDEMASIMRLPELQELTLWCLDEITDAVFINHVSSLKILDCLECRRLTNVGFSKLLQNSSERLQKIKIIGCRNVYFENLILDAKNATDTRNTGLFLILILKKKSQPSCKKQKITKLSKYLEVIEYDE